MGFDAHNYFREICRTNRLAAAGNYVFCRVTGISNMEEAIRNFKTAKAFFCIDDTENGTLIQHGGGYAEQREYVVFLLKRYPLNSMEAQHEALNECRQIYRQIMKKLIRDRRMLEDEMIFIDFKNIPFSEVAGYFLSGCTGLFFSITANIPTELCYDGNEWI